MNSAENVMKIYFKKLISTFDYPNLVLDIQQLRIIFDYFNEKGSGQKLIDFYAEKKGGVIENCLRR